jgi:hypothetical protein
VTYYCPPDMQITEHGPPIDGLTHKGKPVPAYIVNGAGQRAIFARVATDDSKGRTPLAQLCRGECLLAPGLIYRDELSK